MSHTSFKARAALAVLAISTSAVTVYRLPGYVNGAALPLPTAALCAATRRIAADDDLAGVKVIISSPTRPAAGAGTTEQSGPAQPDRAGLVTPDHHS